MRAGTENLAGIAALGMAAEMAAKNLDTMKEVERLRDRFEKEACPLFPKAKISGGGAERLPNTSHI